MTLSYPIDFCGKNGSLRHGGNMRGFRLMEIAIVFVVLLLPKFAVALDWLPYLKGQCFEGDIPDCQIGTRFNMQTCHVTLALGDFDQFGGLPGRLDAGMPDRQFQIRLEYFPQAQNPYKMEITNSNYRRGLASYGDPTSLLSLVGPAGDMEPTIIKLGEWATNPDQIDFLYQNQVPMKMQVYAAAGQLRRSQNCAYP